MKDAIARLSKALDDLGPAARTDRTIMDRGAAFRIDALADAALAVVEEYHARSFYTGHGPEAETLDVAIERLDNSLNRAHLTPHVEEIAHLAHRVISLYLSRASGIDALEAFEVALDDAEERGLALAALWHPIQVAYARRAIPIDSAWERVDGLDVGALYRVVEIEGYGSIRGKRIGYRRDVEVIEDDQAAGFKLSIGAVLACYARRDLDDPEVASAFGYLADVPTTYEYRITIGDHVHTIRQPAERTTPEDIARAFVGQINVRDPHATARFVEPDVIHLEGRAEGHGTPWTAEIRAPGPGEETRLSLNDLTSTWMPVADPIIGGEGSIIGEGSIGGSVRWAPGEAFEPETDDRGLVTLEDLTPEQQAEYVRTLARRRGRR